MAYRSGITLVIPSIPPRNRWLKRAMTSALNQDRQFSDIIVTLDFEKEGAGPTRTRGLQKVDTEWVAFLDDDDELYPFHTEVLIHAATANGADLVYPWFDVKGGTDPFPMHEGKVFDPENPNMFPITVLARTELLHSTPGFVYKQSRRNPEVYHGEDWMMWLSVIKAGGKILHVPQRTWLWHHDSGNTSGRPERW